MTEDNFWQKENDEVDNLKLGSAYPPVKIYISAIDLAGLNSLEPVMLSVILSDGKELDIELMLETNRDEFAKDLRKVLDEANEDSS